MPTIGHATQSAARLRARCAHESAQVPSSVGSEDSAMFLTQFHEMSELLPYISNNDWRGACALVGAHRPLRILGEGIRQPCGRLGHRPSELSLEVLPGRCSSTRPE